MKWILNQVSQLTSYPYSGVSCKRSSTHCTPNHKSWVSGISMYG